MISNCLGINQKGHLTIGGIDTLMLAEEYGTPLYVMDEDKIRQNCRSYVQSIATYYGSRGKAAYASKAFNCKEILRIVHSEGMDVEVVSGGELYTALQAGIPASSIHFQGNNKSHGEIVMAVENELGDLVVDNLQELFRIQEVSASYNRITPVTIRVKPGIDAHTHAFIRTGQIDSKFGVALENGEAFEAVKLALSLPNIKLQGLHCHIGSQIFDTEPFVHAAEVMLHFYRELKEQLGAELSVLNLGGGFGIAYQETDNAVPYDKYMQLVSEKVYACCREYALQIPEIIIEPGRSVVGEAGITLYTVGDIKEIEGVRNYVAIDGGMFENPRYALYQAQYTCLIADRAGEAPDYIATIAGKCCESGDLIAEHTRIQAPKAGDILAVLATGAYNYSMSSNYNRNLRPAVVMVSKGASRIIIRGETYEDLVRGDV